MKDKLKTIGMYCLMIGLVVFLISILFYIFVFGLGASYYGGTSIIGIVDNVSLLTDQGNRFDVYLVNYTDQSSDLMFLPPDYNFTSGFKYWFQGQFQGDYYQAITEFGTFRGKVFNCMAVYDEPGSHKALWVTRGVTTTYSDHYISSDDKS